MPKLKQPELVEPSTRTPRPQCIGEQEKILAYRDGGFEGGQTSYQYRCLSAGESGRTEADKGVEDEAPNPFTTANFINEVVSDRRLAMLSTSKTQAADELHCMSDS